MHGSCPATRTDTSVPLLHLPLVVLTDRNYVSACDAFSGAVKDLRLGTLVGTRTAGIVSAPATGYLLDDSSVLGLPAHRTRPVHRTRPRHRQSTHPARRLTRTKPLAAKERRGRSEDQAEGARVLAGLTIRGWPAECTCPPLQPQA